MVASDDEIRAALTHEPVAVVGCSRTPGKAAYDVPAFFHDREYDVIPGNPFVDETFGREAADSLAEVTGLIDVVCISARARGCVGSSTRSATETMSQSSGLGRASVTTRQPRSREVMVGRSFRTDV
ncbi:hypothetical protein SAMN05443661_13530 [Natronobacterium gregoryi]|uniref:CoA-binding domain-containing protein n=2 Tax=Natronobacterium gregoryi TaxID=44930 RepID=L0AFN1_NATGS|nr:hypothetical protein Natgr_0627 [Natronobacterium gregoryi SP2]ELY73054.1 CoA-binding domain-containing protein [Natronobacterium gregoryi SP2]PLK19392.1 CoA-binding protein [Natronobacterium gregoryi SP2]SFJ51008.1 hypothetical protein SAMN05443661_13530 [Natronobacterium gregoryi]